MRRGALRLQLWALRWLRDAHQPIDDLVTGDLLCVKCGQAWPCSELGSLSDRAIAVEKELEAL